MKQTAVEWFQDQIIKIVNGTCELSEIQIFEQAKAMEMEQMCDFFREGYIWCNSPNLRIENGEIVTNTIKYGEFYYNKKYKDK